MSTRRGGEFTQAQRVGDWRSESDQSGPDPATRAVHQIIGAEHESDVVGRWRLEIYRNHWRSLSPYFTNTLNGVSLVPELEPDRVLIAPSAAETSGLELSGRRALGDAWSLWGTYTFSSAADELGGVDVPRSWDQRQAAALGIAWRQRRLSASLLNNWHTGWPRTPISVSSRTPLEADYAIGPRNSARWSNYFSASARLAYTLPLPVGDLSLWIESTNLTNRDNACCTDFAATDQATAFPALQTRSWLPRIINAGFSWGVGRSRAGIRAQDRPATIDSASQ